MIFFDSNIISTEVGCRKPQEEIYRILLSRLEERGIAPNEAVFIDDEPMNLEPAMELVVKTILFEGLESLEAKLLELGAEI